MGARISCRDASRAISQLLDARVDVPLYLRLRLHLLWCEACSRFLAQARFLRAAMQRYKQ
jgi:hypothetical protein